MPMAIAARALPLTAGFAPGGRLRESIIKLGEMSVTIPDKRDVIPKTRIVARGIDDMVIMGDDARLEQQELRESLRLSRIILLCGIHHL